MPWSTTRTGTNPKYRTKQHRDERARLEREMQTQGHLICNQPDIDGALGAGCIMASRVIQPGQRWCAGHDSSGTVYIGAVHERCNGRDAAVRANRRSRGVDKPRAWDI